MRIKRISTPGSALWAPVLQNAHVSWEHRFPKDVHCDIVSKSEESELKCPATGNGLTRRRYIQSKVHCSHQKNEVDVERSPRCTRYEKMQAAEQFYGLLPFVKNKTTWMYTCMSISVCKNIKGYTLDFPGGTVVKNLPANAGVTGLSPGPGRSYMVQSG